MKGKCLYECGIMGTHGHKSAVAVTEYLEDLKECAPTYTLWSNSEEELAEPLRGMASCLERCFTETEEQVKELNDNLNPTLHEYVLCTETLKVGKLPMSVFSSLNLSGCLFVLAKLYKGRILFLLSLPGVKITFELTRCPLHSSHLGCCL